MEDWFFDSRHSTYLRRYDLSPYKDILALNTETILNLLKRKSIKATFFVLGKLAESMPDLVKTIAIEGHEIASHGWDHTPLYNMTDAEFREDIRKSDDAIFKAISVHPKGYRAPMFSINHKNLHLLDIIKESGYIYDSSIFPTNLHPKYGMNLRTENENEITKGLIEIPMSVFEIAGLKLPFSGGAYFRFYPYSLFNFLFKKCNKANKSVVFYFHPWEISNSIPDELTTPINKLRIKYQNGSIIDKLDRMTDEHRFVSVSEYISTLLTVELNHV